MLAALELQVQWHGILTENDLIDTDDDACWSSLSRDSDALEEDESNG